MQQLSPVIIGPPDIKRLLRELGEYEELMHQRLLTKGVGLKSQPHYHSVPLKETAEELSLDIDRKADREKLVRYLEDLQKTAPVINVYFASEPSSRALQRIARWFRAEVQPATLLEVGIRPSIIGGCIIRTTNRVFDYSLSAKSGAADKALSNQLKALVERV